MKLPILDIKDVELKKVIYALQTVLSRISSDNMKSEEIRGNTDSITDTARQFKHNLKAPPSLWFALEGDVYIPRYGIDKDFVDIRSSKSSEEFRVLLIY